MLKIKNEVDLKELEKFGFVKSDGIYLYRNKYKQTVINVCISNREIIGLGDKQGNIVLYRLIKANLVEEV